ncbi:MAG: hypothetical protein AB7S70_04595 [Hyphomicrobium sp.]|uniref:hypothetical protein n=1 Tax=Hyphomicrobium sp. TaxID=82 RepID=UPI003D13C082
MGKLSVFMAMKRDLAFEFERELRAVRNLILGVSRVSGTDYTIELIGSDGFVAGSRARAAFVEAFHAATHEALVKYAHDLAHECLEHGMDQDIVGSALGGHPGLAPTVRMMREQTMPQQPHPLHAQAPMQAPPGMPPQQVMQPQPPMHAQPPLQPVPMPAAEAGNPVRLSVCA